MFTHNDEPAVNHSTDNIIDDLNNKVDTVYWHTALQEDYSTRVRDYGEGCIMSEVEAHILGYICDHEETTVTHLASRIYRTKGSVSKMLKKLEDKGLIERHQKDGNKKWVYFVPTEEGLHINAVHRSYDRVKTMELIEALLKDCTMEEIESFYKVTALRLKYFENKAQDGKE